MANRVLLGKKGSDYGLWVSKPTLNVLTEGDDDLLLSSTSASMGQVLFFQTIDVGASTTVTQAYLNQGGVKTFCMWWTNDDYLGGGENDRYSTDIGFATSSVGLTVTNTYTNSTTNTITVVNSVASATSIIVMILKEAAA